MKAVRTYSRKPREQEAVPLPGAEWLCRLCLQEPQDPMPIFTSTDCVGLCLATRITFCVGLEMTQDDFLPNQICCNCYKELERCHQFRKKCEASYQRLKSHSLAKIIERDKCEKNAHDQTENEIESNNEGDHNPRNITENHSYEESRNINVEVYDIEESSQNNDVEMCYNEKASHTNVGGNSLLPYSNQNSLVLEIDGTNLIQSTDSGLNGLPQHTTSISVLKCQRVQPKPNLIPSINQTPTTIQLQSQPILISPPKIIKSQPQPRHSLLLDQTASQLCPPLQSQPSNLRISNPPHSVQIPPQISSPKPQIHSNSISQSNQPIIQSQPNKLSIATAASNNQEDVNWVQIDLPALQSQPIQTQRTLKFQPHNIPAHKSHINDVSTQKSPTKNYQSISNNQTQSHSNPNQSSCKHKPPSNMTMSSLLENILTCVGALKQDGACVALNGVTEVDLTMGEGTVVHMELVEEEEESVSPNVTSEPAVKMERLDDIVKPNNQPLNSNTKAPRKTCCVCNATFATSSTRARHERDVHGCARPHTCTTCGASFSQSSVLRRHLNTHMETRPFACTKCPKTFAQRGSLHAHQQSHEPRAQRDVKRCPFDECGKIFQYSSGLSRHLQWHDGRHFVCHSCRRAFTDKSALRRHLRSEKHRRGAVNGNKDVGRYIVQCNKREN